MKMNILLAFLLLLPVGVKGQKVIAWDDTTPVEWRGGFELVDIPSTKDGSMQKAYLYRSRKSSPQPLIVSLHTWSGNYKQKDPLVAEVIARGPTSAAPICARTSPAPPPGTAGTGWPGAAS